MNCIVMYGDGRTDLKACVFFQQTVETVNQFCKRILILNPKPPTLNRVEEEVLLLIV
jgi:uncharacterized protein with von Willebrand factor type A (vWA) domain